MHESCRPTLTEVAKPDALKVKGLLPAHDPGLRVLFTGMESCQPCHAFGPAVRDCHLIHFCLNGRGFFRAGNGSTYLLSAGQGFLIEPDQNTYYQADDQDPWTYVWIGYSGADAAAWTAACGLGQAAPVFGTPGAVDAPVGELFRRIGRTAESGHPDAGSLRRLGWLYELFACLLEALPAESARALQERQRNIYVRQACEYLALNYSQPLRITDLAARLGLDRSHFGSVFRQATGQTPRDYLRELRMRKAQDLLRRTNLRVSAIAHQCGYEDPLLFSRMFRRFTGLCPTDYRRARQTN